MPSFKRSFLGGSGRESSSASDSTLADVSIASGALGAHTRCLLSLLIRVPTQVCTPVIFRMLEQKHSIISSGIFEAGELLTRVSAAGMQNSTFLWVLLKGLRSLILLDTALKVDDKKLLLCSLAVYAVSD